MKIPAVFAVSFAVASLVHASPANAAPPSGAHPRFLLGNAKAQLVAKKTEPEIAGLVSKCAGKAGSTIASGYQGWDWVTQMSTCTIAWYATGDAAHATQAVKYWRALLDDNTSVGDKGGGATGYGGKPIVSQDDGYSMRTYGAYGALGLDWLYDAPGVDETLRQHARDLLVTWHNWYASSGYLNDVPESNYFTGYFLATWAAAIAVGTDAPSGNTLWDSASSLTDRVKTSMQSGFLLGGDWIEGSQYGELAASSLLVASAAAAENGYGAFADKYAHDVVLFHLHALQPGDKFFDNGDHEDHPVDAASGSVWAAMLSAPAAPVSGWAQQYVTRIGDSSPTPWVRAVAKAKSTTWAPADWTTANGPLSYLSSGTGTVVARSGWGEDAVWVSFQSAGRSDAGHQHNDAGHFEIFRGKDALAITTADYGTWSSANNNTFLVDDGGRNSNYPPCQGASGDPSKVRISRFADVNVAVWARGEFGDSYVSNHGKSSVQTALRDWVYLRPNLVVVSDRVVVDQPSVSVTFALHTSKQPTITGSELTADVGGSHMSSQTLLPATSTRRTVNEPTGGGDAPWSNNDTYAPAFRAEEKVSGATTANFVHVLSALATGATAPASSIDVQSGARVIHIAGDPSHVVVVADAASAADLTLPLSYSVPNDPHQDHGVFGLPGKNFAVSVTADGTNCKITLTAGTDPKVTSTDATAAFHLDGCAVGTPPGLPGNPEGDGGAPGNGADGGVGADGSTTTTTTNGANATDAADDSGCTCSVGPVSVPSPRGFALIAVGLAFVARRAVRRERRSGSR
ncbi:Fibronectin type III domain protein [Labilithrix luteola]|uniref:Fibronectin type III domain protein n=1 Tax=Labilithrix luteola TaxID=1391654 RepID=A0A0K1QEK3_9BACT|nr:hypothetical protein [Labilithrix luteola]AKV03850.1 Fibronectin type III domain protein [Labilithrix luteola]